MSGSAQQGFISLMYATWLHNAEVLAYFVGIMFALYLLYKHPSRARTLLLVAFTALLIRFEYIKHIVDPLQQQTVGVVVTQDGDFGARRLIDLILNDAVSLSLYMVGWGSLFGAIFTLTRKNEDHK
jgi:hypothetical protein